MVANKIRRKITFIINKTKSRKRLCIIIIKYGIILLTIHLVSDEA